MTEYAFTCPPNDHRVPFVDGYISEGDYCYCGEFQAPYDVAWDDSNAGVYEFIPIREAYKPL
jgi:hypothetical protein